MKFSAVILAGGASARMGQDKAGMELGGKTLLARQIQLARDTGAVEIFISGRMDRDDSRFGCRVLHDKFSDAGPLAGMERALAAVSSSLLLVLAVDLGGMTAEFLRSLVLRCDDSTGAIPRLDGNIEPLAAFYPGSAWQLAHSQLEQRVNAAKDFAAACVKTGRARFSEIAKCNEHLFENWNSPSDLRGER